MKGWRFLPRSVRYLAGHARKHYRETGSVKAAAEYAWRLGLWTHQVGVERRTVLQTLPGSAKEVSAANVVVLQRKVPLICLKVTGGLGDYLVIARFMRDLAKNAEPFEFDVYCSSAELMPWVFGSVPGFRKAYHECLFDHLYKAYSLAMQANQFVLVHTESSWSAIRDCPKLVRILDHVMRFRPKIDVMIDRHPYMDGFLGQKAVYMNRTRADFLHAMAKIPYGGHAYPMETDPSVFNELGLDRKPYVTINNGFDTNFFIAGKRATKCYPHSSELVREIKARYPGLTVVQIGASTSVPIEEADISLINKTSLRQAAAILKGAQLHIDTEGGLVHLAKCLDVQSCVIFGPTSVDYFAYPDNINVKPTFCGGCWWINESWMEACPRGFEEARCMTEQKPRLILAEIEKAWEPRGLAGHLGQAGEDRKVKAIGAAKH